MQGNQCIGFAMEKANINNEISHCVEVMRQGGIILYPTDTVWGIGCDATNPTAVKRIYDLKQRADHKAMIILVDSEAMLDRHVDGVPEVAWELIDAAVSPTTIVFDKGVGLAPELLGADGSVVVRLTREHFSAALCQRLHHPVVSTSANISGEKPARFFSEIPQAIIAGVDYVADFRRDDFRPCKPSNVIRLTNSGIVEILRK